MTKRILIIDDDPDILEILDIIFKQEGYEVVLSETGHEAEDIAGVNPDLVLLDIRITGSGRNGADICAKIKSRRETQDLPVIMVSSEENLEEICARCKANGYIRKPFEISALITKINELFAA
jgi:two-component system response regulator VicR